MVPKKSWKESEDLFTKGVQGNRVKTKLIKVNLWQKTKKQSLTRNPKIKRFSTLIGEWNTIRTHSLLSRTIFYGHVSFESIEDRAFLLRHSKVEEQGIRSDIAVFGCDDSSEVVSMLYFDERGVSRIYQNSLSGKIWKSWRNSPGFSQRFTGTFADEGNTITGIWELSKDGSNWARDLEQTYSRDNIK